MIIFTRKTITELRKLLKDMGKHTNIIDKPDFFITHEEYGEHIRVRLNETNLHPDAISIVDICEDTTTERINFIKKIIESGTTNIYKNYKSFEEKKNKIFA